MPSVIERASRLALDLLFPPQCALCRRGGSMLCDRCAAMLPPADGQRCERCWTPVSRGGLCDHCRVTSGGFEVLRAPFVLEGGARDLVHQLKYQGMSSLAEPMAALMAERIGVDGGELIVPVPLHRGRQRSRGYNQSSLLAKHLARAVGSEVDVTAVVRTKATRSLAKSMSREERRSIVEGAFAGRGQRIDGRRVLLLDDVVTTGATLESCTRALLDGGAASVRCVTFARAD